MNKKVAEFSMSKKDFGFVIDGEEKYFVALKNTLNAADKDIVNYEIIDYKGKKEAKITKIIKRKTDEFIGILQKNKSFAFVLCSNISKDIYISKSNMKKYKDGDFVKVKIIDWDKKSPEAKILTSYGSSKNAENIVEVLLQNNNIEAEFDVNSINIANSLKTKIDYSNRIDLSDKMHITIDSEDTKDIDDAIYLEKENDNYILYVSIADVSHYIKQDSYLDNIAKKRGNSIYLYHKSIPMLPRILTNDICSLNPNEEKLAFTVKIVYDKDAKVISADFFKSIICSKFKLSYNKVNELLRSEEKTEYSDMLFEMNELSKKLSDLSIKRSCIEFEIPEIKLKLDNKFKIEEITLRTREDAEILIENFMVAANEQVAKYLYYLEMPAVYRIHEKPELESMKNLNEELKKFNLNYKDPRVLEKKLQNLIEKTKNFEYGYLISKLVLRSMKKAIYFKEDKGHFGLGLEHYLHFTSPIRRYSDLIVHRILNDALNKYMDSVKKTNLDKRLNEICKHISFTERQAQKIEYQARDIKIAEYMADFVNKEYDAIISSENNGKYYVTLSNYAEALLINRDVSYIIGDKVKVLIREVDVLNGKIYVKLKN